MSRKMRTLLLIGALTVPLFTARKEQFRLGQLDRGEEWLSWSSSERATFIDGFLAGYSTGGHKACNSIDDIFEVGRPHRLGDDPTARCEGRLETYSKYGLKDSGPDFTAYTIVITDFYSKHPEYRKIPFVYLMSFLSDRQYKTAEQLYQMALKGEMRTNF